MKITLVSAVGVRRLF